MADIRKRTGSKGVTYQVRYPSNETAVGYAYKTFKTMKAARAFTQNLGGLPEKVTSHIRTVPQAVTEWLDICEKIGRDGRETVEPATLEEYRRRGRIISEYPWPKSLQEIEPVDVVRFRSWLLENKSRDLARRTLSSLHSIFIEMKHQGHIKDDPAAGITVKTGRYEEEESVVEIPSDQEMRALFAAADALATKNEQLATSWARYRPMIYLAGFSGMRPSEYRGLAWSQVQADHVTVRQRADKNGIIGPVKSRAGRRTIYLPQLVMDMLADWKRHSGASDDALVFPTSTGKPQLLGRFRRSAWVPLLKEADLMVKEVQDGEEIERPKYTLYSLRHYFASKLIEKGKDLKFIQETMGHSRIEVTLNVYGHLLKDREEARKQTAEELVSEILMN